MSSVKASFSRIAGRFLPFWFYILLFKFGAGIHYSLVAVLGARILPLWAVGLCVGATAGIQLVLDVPAGFLLERYGHLRMLRLSTLCFIVAAGVLLFGLTPATYLATILLSGLGWLFFGPGISAYLLAHGPVAFIGRLTGLRRMCEAIGITLALLGLTHFSTFPAPLVGLLILSPLAGALIALLLAIRHSVPTVLGSAAHGRRIVARAPFVTLRTLFTKLHPIVTVLGIHTLCISIFYAMVWFLLPLLVARGASDYRIALAALDFTVLLVDMPVGFLVDRLPKRPLIVIGMVMLAASALTMSQATSMIVILLAIILSVGDEIAIVALWAWLDTRTSHVHHEGIITGATTFLEDVGWMLGPILAGGLASVLSATDTLLAGATVLAVGTVASTILLYGIPVHRPDR